MASFPQHDEGLNIVENGDSVTRYHVYRIESCACLSLVTYAYPDLSCYSVLIRAPGQKWLAGAVPGIREWFTRVLQPICTQRILRGNGVALIFNSARHHDALTTGPNNDSTPRRSGSTAARLQ